MKFNFCPLCGDHGNVGGPICSQCRAKGEIERNRITVLEASVAELESALAFYARPAEYQRMSIAMAGTETRAVMIDGGKLARVILGYKENPSVDLPGIKNAPAGSTRTER